MKDRTRTIELVAALLASGQHDDARTTLRSDYPFSPARKSKNSLSKHAACRVFLRDGWIDRYRGTRLVFPGALHLISLLLPEELPYHPHGRMQSCHLAFWDLFPTIDHVVPLARGGSNEWSNLVCTSMSANQVKSGWLLEELGWELGPPGKLEEWDGLVAWFLAEYPKRPEFRKQRPALREWAAAERAVWKRPVDDDGIGPAPTNDRSDAMEKDSLPTIDHTSSRIR